MPLDETTFKVIIDGLNDNTIWELSFNGNSDLTPCRYRKNGDKGYGINFFGSPTRDQLVKLAAALSQNNSLLWLIIRGCYVGPEGAQAVARALLSNNSLISLSLGEGTKIGDAGASALVAAIIAKRETVLKDLTLDDCGISDIGALAIASLANESSLMNISIPDISNNSAIGYAGAKALLEASRIKCGLILNISDQRRFEKIVQDHERGQEQTRVAQPQRAAIEQPLLASRVGKVRASVS